MKKLVKPDCCDINKCCIHAKAVIGLCKVRVVGVLLWQRCIYACRSMQSVGVGQLVMMFLAENLLFLVSCAFVSVAT